MPVEIIENQFVPSVRDAAGTPADAAAAKGSERAHVLSARWLQQRLAAGPAESATLKSEAHLAGIGPKALRVARQKLELIVTRSGHGLAMRSTWSLPSPSSVIAPQPVEPLAAAGDRGPQWFPDWFPGFG